MKKNVSTRSAFFNLRALCGLALCILGIILAGVAFNGLTLETALGQGAGQRGLTVARDKDLAAAVAPRLTEGVRPVLTRPLREMKAISSARAPGHDHPEPIYPAGPTEAGPDTAIQNSGFRVESAPAATGLNFDAVGVGMGNFSPNSNPPDTNGQVGATQYVQWNNTSLAVFDKTTGATLLGPIAGNTLFQAIGGVCATHNDGDPVVNYDIMSGRWVLSQFVVGGPAGSFSHQCFAVSQTQDATGAYYLYDFLTDANNFIDYEKVATWPDGYYMSGHVFNAAGTQFLMGRIYAFERSQMLVGGPARMVSSNLPPNGTSQQIGFVPADVQSLTPPPVGEAEFLIGPANTTANASSTRVAVTWGSTPTIALTSALIPITPYTNAPCLFSSANRQCVPQPSPATTADYLDQISTRYMWRLAYRNNGTQANPQESILATITVNGTPPPNHGAIRWYEFRNSGNSTTAPTVFQMSTYDPDTNYRWIPSISMDKDGDIAIGYSKSSTTVKPSIYVTGRLASDPINTMSAEISMLDGQGVQQAGGNRWGDYSAMTVDPVDQCTFYYTNEYLKTNGNFNWSTRIASFRFPSCVSAPAWGTVSGTVTSTETGVPLSGVIVTLTGGYSAATDANGHYSVLAPPGNYAAVATDPLRNCTYASPDTVPVFISSGGNISQDYTIQGNSKLELTTPVVSDSATGNNNAVINKAECVNLNLPLRNNGCRSESAVSATLTTSTPGVTVLDSSATYPDMLVDAGATNTTPFRISVDPSFVCGTTISFTLNLTYSTGNKTIQFTMPSCTGGADQTIPLSQLTSSSATQADRVGRNGLASTCAGKAAPGGGFTSTGPHYYQTYNFTNDGGAAACFTVTINAAANGPGDIESAAYLNTYDPANLNTNYLGDTGISGLGTTVTSASYSFTVPALSNFVVVVETAGKTLDGSNNASSPFSGTVSGFYNQTPGPGVCPAAPAAPVLSSAASRVNGLDTPVALTGQISTEPRNGAGNYLVVLNFDSPLQSGAASVVSGTGTAGTPAFSGNSMLIPLTGVTDLQRLSVRATNVANTAGGVLAATEVTIGFIIGDTNGDGSVAAADIAQTKSQSGMTVTASNCREDVNNDGSIGAADISFVKSRSGTALP